MRQYPIVDSLSGGNTSSHERVTERRRNVSLKSRKLMGRRNRGSGWAYDRNGASCRQSFQDLTASQSASDPHHAPPFTQKNDCVDPVARERSDGLVEKSNEGELSPDERAEYALYVSTGTSCELFRRSMRTRE